MAISIAELRQELTLDPANIGYVPAYQDGRNASRVAELINARTRSKIDRAEINVDRLISRLYWPDIIALPDAEREVLGMLLQRDTLRITRRLKDGFTLIFANSASNRAALRGRIERNQSRAEELFGIGVVVRAGHIERALT